MLSRKYLGFTLIEVLVVMVIMSLTTTLLVSGLSTTWKNFDKLTARNLRKSTSNLAQHWFNQSFKGAVMYHPYEPNFSGNSSGFSHVTTSAPSSSNTVPLKIEWKLANCDTKVCDLQFSINNNKTFVVISTLSRAYQFYYLIDGQWESQFQPDTSMIPQAIKISTRHSEWTFASTGRPVNADMPPELPLFGKYEF